MGLSEISEMNETALTLNSPSGDRYQDRKWTEEECLERLFTPTRQEAYVAERLKKDHGLTVDLNATASIRKGRIRSAIQDSELQNEVCVSKRSGKQMTYSETYLAMYGEPLHKEAA